MKKNILINENEGTLVLAKGFAKKAFSYGTKEYRMLQECRKDYPTYTVEVRSISKNSSQDHYKGLTYENMEIYILTHENAEENIVIFNNKKEIAEMHSSCKRYGTIKNWFLETYPEVKEYMNKNVEFAKQTGYAKTLLGRRRYIRELLSSNYNLRQFGERVAMNMPLQGSSADIIKLAMLGVNNRLRKENLKSELILQVHDELIVDAFIDEKDKVIKILQEEMEGAVKLSVPLTVSVGYGKTWFDAK